MNFEEPGTSPFDTPRPKIRGVYFLIDKGEVVYVGKSGDVLARLSHHFFSKAYTFDESRYIEVNCGGCGQELCECRSKAELEMIRKYTPKYNVKDNPLIDWGEYIKRTTIDEENRQRDRVETRYLFYAAGLFTDLLTDDGMTRSWDSWIEDIRRDHLCAV